jgi:lantibiotic modifying enzyme
MKDPHGNPISRRSLLAGALGAAGALALPRTLHAHVTGSAPANVPAAPAPVANVPAPAPDLESALRAERWLRSVAVKTDHGTAWPADPEDTATVQRNLYTGTPGVVLFLLELHAATSDDTVLDRARAGAADLAGTMARQESDTLDCGLYTGLAGVAYTLLETWRSTGDARYRTAAEHAVQVIAASARPAGDGVEWSESDDIISGGSGIALFLLWAAKTLEDDRLVDLAKRAGIRLAALGQPEHGGLKWPVAPDFPNLYPNFSHGTAGVSYTLATLHGVTKEPLFLERALQGAKYLDAVTNHDGGCKVFHHEPGGEDLYYLSWCHGGAGTARLYHRLAEVTGDAAWNERVACLAEGITAMGAPVERSPGYWENISQCCGDAGVGEFFLSLERLRPGRGHLQVARRAADDIVNRASAAGDGLKWVQAEHRVRPEFLVAQTGFMQGAAGVGTFLLHLDAQAKGRASRIVLPDSPFA